MNSQYLVAKIGFDTAEDVEGAFLSLLIGGMRAMNSFYGNVEVACGSREAAFRCVDVCEEDDDDSSEI